MTAEVTLPYVEPVDTTQRLNLISGLAIPQATERIATQSTWTGMRTLAGIMSRTSSLCGPLKSAADGILASIDIVEEASKSSVELEKIRAELDKLCEDLSRHLNDISHPAMTSCIMNLALDIESETQYLLQKKRNKSISRYAEAQEDADQILQCYRRIQGLMNRLTLNVNLNMWRIADEHAASYFMKLLPYTSVAKYRSARADGCSREECAPNTRISVLKHLQDWLSDHSGRRICWLNGMAGTGKTTIACSFCHAMENTERLAASFFCSRQIPACRDVNLIVPSLSYQLSLFSRPFRYVLCRTLEQNPDAYNQPLMEQFEALLAGPLKEVESTLPKNLAIVIDALDECGNPDGINQILNVLLLHAPNLPVKFLVTSRPEPGVLDFMWSVAASAVQTEICLHELDRLMVRDDIKTYLTYSLGRIQLSLSQLEHLTDRSGELFIYAATVVRYIGYGKFSRYIGRLEQVLRPSQSCPNNSEKEIDTLYAMILSAALDNPSLEDLEKHEMKQVLDSVICIQEPMTVETIAGLLKLNSTSSVLPALEPLYSVLHVSKTSGLVTTLHASFSNYLLDQRRSGRFHCNQEEQHAQLAQRCFDLINVPDIQFNICGLNSSFLFDEEVQGIDQTVDAVISKELFYASLHWVDHLELGRSSKSLEASLFRILSTKLLVWMEILNLKKAIHLGADALYRTHSWSQKTESSDDFRELVDDAWKFVTMFSYSAMPKSTPHIYVSGLPFWPKHRPISRHYFSKAPGTIDATGTAMPKRNAVLLSVFSTTDGVACAAYSHDGSRLVTGSESGPIHIWDAHTSRALKQSLEGHTDLVTSVIYTPDGEQIISGSRDKTICIWDAVSYQLLRQPLKGHTHWVTAVAYCPASKSIISGSHDTTIRIWNACDGQTKGEPLRGHSDSVTSLSYAPESKRVASGSRDKAIRIWDVLNSKMIGKPLTGHTDSVNCVVYSPSGAYIASGSCDRTIRIWDAIGGKILGEPLRGHTASVTSIAYSPTGMQIVSGSGGFDRTVRVWDLRTGQVVGQLLRGHTGSVDSVVYSPNSGRIVSTSQDKTVRIWDTQAFDQAGAPTPGSHVGPFECISCSPSGTYIVSSSLDEPIHTWDTKTGRIVGPHFEGTTTGIRSVAHSSDGTHLASGSGDGLIHIWDTSTGCLKGHPLMGHSGSVTSIVYSLDGTLIASCSEDKTVRIWNARTGQAICQPLEGHAGRVNSVAYSPDSSSIASGSDDCTVRIWSVPSHQPIDEPLRRHSDSVASVVYSPTGTHVASACRDCTILIWDLRTSQTVAYTLRGHTGPVTSVAYSPDGLYLVSGSYDWTVCVWDAHTGQMVGRPYEGHADWVSSVAYLSDGRYVVSGSFDSTIRIWDTQRSESSLDFWTLDNDGWVVTSDSKRLVWVPVDVRNLLLRPQNTVIMSGRGWFELDFSSAKLGEEWYQCYRPGICVPLDQHNTN